MRTSYLVDFSDCPNNVGLKPYWVEVWIDGDEIATIDWNNRDAVRMFATEADGALRTGLNVETRPV
jgi:hypothetical protein